MTKTPNIHKKPSSFRYFQEGVPDVDVSEWRLTITNEKNETYSFNFQDILKYPEVYQSRRSVCVCLWSIKRHWNGVLLHDLLTDCNVDVRDPSLFLKQVSIPAKGGVYDSTIHLASAVERDAMLAHTVDGGWLPPEQGYPLRLIDFGLYGYKCVKSLDRLVVTHENKLGYWEDYAGYSVDGTIQPKKYYMVDLGRHIFFDGEGEISDDDIEL